jgi:hypothetical protein
LNLGIGGMRFPEVWQWTCYGVSLHTDWTVFSQAVRNMQFRVGGYWNGPGLRNGAGTFQVEEATTLRVQCLMMMPIQFKNGFNRFLQLFECPERTLNIFVSLIVSFLWQEHQALNEKSESLMTTGIELTMNSHHWQKLYFRQER